MTGGPGGDAIGDIPFLIDAGVNRTRDLIVMAQRGTLHSQPNLACPEIDRFYAAAVGLRYDASSTGRRLVRATKECRERLTADGVELSAYNTTENAADFADLRKALGIDRWNVYGYSYGTDLALTFLRRHPRGSDRSRSTPSCRRVSSACRGPGTAPVKGSTRSSRRARPNPAARAATPISRAR
ncbi:alpha/beta fold hydrolase [Streptomyces sp. MS1.AVA.1]|uniref:Alpha/beta fold hydrolase n=1 Tax=Streptomyces machairae TaxID=3134109 RepID=A0ABU8UUL8_9ACTN